MLIDLQVHSNFGSPDSALSYEQIIEGCQNADIQGVALTEHRAVDSKAPAVFARAGLVLVPGREVSCAGAHLLILSADASVFDDLPVLIDPQTLARIRKHAAIVWAHPAAPAGSSAYAPRLPKVGPLKGSIDAVEVLNGRHLHFPDAIGIAQELAAELGVALTGGSDAHREGEVGRCVTAVKAGKSQDASGVVEAIKRGDCRAVLNDLVAGAPYRSDLAEYLR